MNMQQWGRQRGGVRRWLIVLICALALAACGAPAPNTLGDEQRGTAGAADESPAAPTQPVERTTTPGPGATAPVATTATAAVSSPTERTAPSMTPDSATATLAAPIATPTSPPATEPAGEPSLEQARAELWALLQPTLPTPIAVEHRGDDAITRIEVLRLTAEQRPPLWLAYSADAYLAPSRASGLAHFMALFTWTDGTWEKLSMWKFPEVNHELRIRQVKVAPEHVWVELEGLAGPYYPCYGLYRLEGSGLTRSSLAATWRRSRQGEAGARTWTATGPWRW